MKVHLFEGATYITECLLPWPRSKILSLLWMKLFLSRNLHIIFTSEAIFLDMEKPLGWWCHCGCWLFKKDTKKPSIASKLSNSMHKRSSHHYVVPSVCFVLKCHLCSRRYFVLFCAICLFLFSSLFSNHLLLFPDIWWGLLWFSKDQSWRMFHNIGNWSLEMLLGCSLKDKNKANLLRVMEVARIHMLPWREIHWEANTCLWQDPHTQAPPTLRVKNKIK